MRLVFATTNLFTPTDLSARYADVSLMGVCSSFTAAIGVTRDVQDSAPVDVAVLEAHLASSLDLEVKLTLAQAIVNLRTINPDLRIVVVAPAPLDASSTGGIEVETLIEIDPKRAAANLATTLGLSLREEVGTIMAVTGLQGGTGRSFISMNLALMYSPVLPVGKDGKGGVLLWEVDLHHPTIAFTRGFPPAALEGGRRTVVNLINLDDSALEGSVDTAMTMLSPSIISAGENPIGVDLLLAPHGIREAMAIYQAYPDLPEVSRRLGHILDIVSRHYKLVILDTGYDPFTDPGMALALEKANIFAPVFSPGPAGLSAAMGFGVIVSDRGMRTKTLPIINRGVRNEADYLPILRDEVSKTMEPPVELGSDPDIKAWRDLADRLYRLR